MSEPSAPLDASTTAAGPDAAEPRAALFHRDLHGPAIALLALLCGLLLIALVRFPLAESSVAAQSVGYRVNVNTATVDELCLLPRVGPSIAQYIVERRASQPFTEPADLLAVRFVGRKTLRHFEDFIRFDAPASPSR